MIMNLHIHKHTMIMNLHIHKHKHTMDYEPTYP